MALLDATASAKQVNATILVYADFQDEPVRACYAPMPLTVPTGLADADADCEGFTFDTMDSQVLQIGKISHGDGGTDTMGFVLHADPDNPELLNAIEDPDLYLGRVVRLWLAFHNNAGLVTELRPVYRGYMTLPAQQSDGTNYVITMEAENYVSLLSEAQNRTYLNSKRYDSGDLSDEVSKGLQPNAPAVRGGGGGFLRNVEVRER